MGDDELRQLAAELMDWFGHVPEPMDSTHGLYILAGAAADELKRLRAERDRLQQTLTALVAACEAWDDDGAPNTPRRVTVALDAARGAAGSTGSPSAAALQALVRRLWCDDSPGEGWTDQDVTAWLTGLPEGERHALTAVIPDLAEGATE